MRTVLDAECSLLTKLRQQHMLNEKQVIFNTYLLMTKMQLNNIYNNMMLITLLINWGGFVAIAR